MKVDFGRTAMLIITPENETERYALKKWFDGYTSDTPPEETLSVNLLSGETQATPKSCTGCKYEPEVECTAECSRHQYDDMFKRA